jgi:putative membrane protein
MMCGPGGCMSGPWGWAMMAVIALFWIALLVGIVLLIVWAVRQIGPAGRNAERPLDILARRYARGEITREEYERMKAELSEHGT